MNKIRLFSKIKNELTSIKPIRYLFYIAVLITVYLLFIETVSNLIDQQRLENNIKDWFENSVNYSTFADIDHTDTALRIDWRTDLYIHEFEIVSPDPDFILPPVFIDTIRASAQFYELFGGVKANPIIQLRDGIVNIQKKSSGNSNLSALTFTDNFRAPAFLPGIDIDTLNILLMNCKINIDYPASKAQIPLTGKLQIKDNRLQLKGISENSLFIIEDSTYTQHYDSTIVTNELTYNLNSQTIENAEISIENIPAGVLNYIFSSLPDIPNNLKLSGKLQAINNSVVFSGILDNQIFTELPRYLNIRISTNNDFISGIRFFHMEVSDRSNIILNLKTEKNIVDEWEPISIFFQKLNLNNLLSGHNNNWIKTLISTFPAINIDVQQADLLGFTVDNAHIDVVTDKEKKTNISLDGNVADGALNLLAKDLSLSDSNTSETIMATLQVKNPADSLLAFSRDIPKILDCTPTSGTGEIALIYENNELDTDIHNLKLQITLSDVIIPTLGGGEAIETLAGLPRELNKLSILCDESRLNSTDDKPELIDNFPSISFEKLSVTYETDSEKQTVTSSLSASSRELGKVTGTFYKSADKNLKLTIILNDIPDETLKMAKISPTALTAIESLENNNLFQISFYETPEKTITRTDYFEDSYRIWLENSSKAEAGPIENN